MPSIQFQNRLIFDDYFYEEIKNNQISNPISPSILIRLMYINGRSSGLKRVHNVMSKKIFDKILEDNPTMPREILRASFYDLDNPEIEKIEDDMERNIKLAIDLLDEGIHRSIIITSEEKKEEYENHPHLVDVKEVSIRSGEDALSLINNYFEQCTARY